jgi:hypothetical protein
MQRNFESLVTRCGCTTADKMQHLSGHLMAYNNSFPGTASKGDSKAWTWIQRSPVRVGGTPKRRLHDARVESAKQMDKMKLSYWI